MLKRLFQVYLVPAGVYVSVVIAGGYGTGREVVEFFSQYGGLGGLLGIAVSSCVFAVVLVLTYEFAQKFNLYDYRSFFSQLIGRAWVVYELLYFIGFFLLLGVISSAAGTLIETQYALPSWVGMLLVMALVIALIYFGRKVLENILTLWTVGMYIVFIIYFIQIVSSVDNAWLNTLQGEIKQGWLENGVLFAMYNLAMAPILLYSVRAIKNRKEAVTAGCFTAILTTIPALLFHICFSISSPDVLEQPIPNYWMISEYASPWLLTAFTVAIFGTLVETAAGLAQGLVERISKVVNKTSDLTLAARYRVMITTAILLIGWSVGVFGIIAIVAKGYTALSIGFFIIYIVPICTIGVFKSFRGKKKLSDMRV